MKLGVLLGSIREGRKSESVGNYIMELGKEFEGIEFTLIDPKEYNLPVMYKRASDYDGTEAEYENVMQLKEAFTEQDGYIFVVPEYNHSLPAVLKNTLDYFYTEYNDKAVGFVSYGTDGGVRAVEQMRLIAAELRMADVRTNPTFSIFGEFDGSNFTPKEFNVKRIRTLIEDVIKWSDALQVLRNK